VPTRSTSALTAPARERLERSSPTRNANGTAVISVISTKFATSSVRSEPLLAGITLRTLAIAPTPASPNTARSR